MIRGHGPLLKTVAAAFFVLIAASALRFDSLAQSTLSFDVFLSFLLGLVYTQFFEFWAHRFPMHRRLRFAEDVRRNHLEHHRIFHGANFRTRRPRDLDHIAGRFWVFPVLFLIHYFPVVALLPLDAATAFLLGCVVHYALFEATHWFTHVEGNAFDRFVESLPIVGPLRTFQIEHHRAHHEKPTFAFNFNPPYLGDRFAGLFREPEPVPVTALPPPPVPEPLVLARRRFLTHQLVRYGAAAAIGVAAVGIVVLAHARLERSKQQGKSTSAV